MTDIQADLSDPELGTKAIYADTKTVSWLKWYMMKRTLELREQNRATLDREGDSKSRNRALLTGAVFRGAGKIINIVKKAGLRRATHELHLNLLRWTKISIESLS